MRIRIAAAVTTLFLAGLAATGVALRSADHAAMPAGADPSMTVAEASAVGPSRISPGTPRPVVTRVSPAVGAQPVRGQEPTVYQPRTVHQPRGETDYD
jgi:hypothetical protein